MVPFLNDFKQILGHGKIQLLQSKIIKDEETGFYHVLHQLVVGSVSPTDREARQETGNTVALNSYAVHAGSSAERGKEICLSDAGGSRDDQVGSVIDPFAS